MDAMDWKVCFLSKAGGERLWVKFSATQAELVNLNFQALPRNDRPLGSQPAVGLWAGSALGVCFLTCKMRRLDIDLFEAFLVMTSKGQGIVEYQKWEKKQK